MKPSGVCANGLENKGETTPDAERCTAGCTESGDRLDELARAVALVASLPLPDADRAAVLARLVAGVNGPAGVDVSSTVPAALQPRVFATNGSGTPATASHVEGGGKAVGGATASRPRVPAISGRGESRKKRTRGKRHG